MLFSEAKEILEKNGYRLVEDTDDSVGMSLKDKIANAAAFNNKDVTDDEDETADIMNRLQQRFDYDYGQGMKGYSVEGGYDEDSGVGLITIFYNGKYKRNTAAIDYLVKLTPRVDKYSISITVRRNIKTFDKNNKDHNLVGTRNFNWQTSKDAYQEIVNFITSFTKYVCNDIRMEESYDAMSEGLFDRFKKTVSKVKDGVEDAIGDYGDVSLGYIDLIKYALNSKSINRPDLATAKFLKANLEFIEHCENEDVDEYECALELVKKAK